MIQKNRTLFLSVLAGLLVTLCIPSCRFNPPVIFPEGSDIYGLASPVRLEGDTTLVYLADYFTGGAASKVDSVTGINGLEFLLSPEENILHIVRKSNFLPPLLTIEIWVRGVPYSLLALRSMRGRVQFTFDPGDARYRRVSLRGEMNDWNPNATPLDMIDGVWQTELTLNPGRYQYLIVADGQDMLDPDNPNVVDNNIGGFNSMLEVGQVDRSASPHLYPKRHRRYNVRLGVENQPDEVFVFWENFRLPPDHVDIDDGVIYIRIPGDAVAHQRSFLRVWAYNDHGPSNDLLIPLAKGRPLVQAEQLTREDKEATILYFMMVDRFNNGNPQNDDPVDDPEVADRANFWGGDIAGITQKVADGYFESLGVNTVWMSPITQNPLEAYVEFPEPRRKYTGYHGYWPITLTTVDHRFGNEQALNELVKVAHRHDISVMLDFVSNHVHEDHPLIMANPDWATTLSFPDGRKNIRLWDEHRLTTWFDTFLPSLDFSRPEVIETMADSAFYWIENFQMDGFRHDATKHVQLDFWRELTKKLKEDYMIPQNKRLFQIGETFGSRELIGSYVGSGLLDGQFDFNLYFDARPIFGRGDPSFEDLDYSLHQSFSHYGFNHLMGNITGNHDLPRFISLAGGGLGWSEDEKEAGWDREVGVGEPVGYKRLSQLTAFIMTIPGVPVLYYGDEIGLPGASDPDSRRPMIFDGLSPHQEGVRNNASKLGHLRSNHLAFIYGDFRTLKADQHTYAYSRSYFDEHALVVFNSSDEPGMIRISLNGPMGKAGQFLAHFGHDFHLSGNVLTIEMEPHSFEVIMATQ